MKKILLNKFVICAMCISPFVTLLDGDRFLPEEWLWVVFAFQVMAIAILLYYTNMGGIFDKNYDIIKIKIPSWITNDGAIRIAKKQVEDWIEKTGRLVFIDPPNNVTQLPQPDCPCGASEIIMKRHDYDIDDANSLGVLAPTDTKKPWYLYCPSCQTSGLPGETPADAVINWVMIADLVTDGGKRQSKQ